MSNYTEIIEFIRNQFPSKDFIPLHEPNFNGNEKLYVLETINSTFVSSVGPYVDKFELMMAELTKTQKAVAVVNGTSALQVSLRLSGVGNGDEVLTQALTFIATINAIIYNGASPVFLAPPSTTHELEQFLSEGSLLIFADLSWRLRESLSS
jgi:dTDP-4-amino-4,6-dideoxygalactose transaminase